MARKPKLHVPGGVYHVMLRGNGGKNIFYTQKDRDHLEELVGEGVIRYGHRIHAYCWMHNHIHLAIQFETWRSASGTQRGQQPSARATGSRCETTSSPV